MRIILFSLALALPLPVKAITIRVDYRFDTEGFFETPGAKEAMQAVADRWSRIITQDLAAVNIQDEDFNDIRFQLENPGNGQTIQLSAAASVESDRLVSAGAGPADIYLDGFTLEEDVWILFAGGRALSSDGRGGSIGLGAFFPTQLGFIGAADDPEGIVNRVFNVGSNSLDVLGRTVAFDVNRDWHFGVFETAPTGTIDFYSIALHEVGHALGLNSTGNLQLEPLLVTGRYTGQFAVDAYNLDNEEQIDALEIVRLSPRDYHWANNLYQSRVFQLGGPSQFGVVGSDVLQDLLMDPSARFTPDVQRLEVTNVEIGALRDLGWSIIAEDPPVEPAPVLGIERSPEGVVRLSIPSREGRNYTIQTSIGVDNWMSVSPALIGDGSNLSWEDGQEGFVDPNESSIDLASKFYRVIEN